MSDGAGWGADGASEEPSGAGESLPDPPGTPLAGGSPPSSIGPAKFVAKKLSDFPSDS